MLGSASEVVLHTVQGQTNNAPVRATHGDSSVNQWSRWSSGDSSPSRNGLMRRTHSWESGEAALGARPSLDMCKRPGDIKPHLWSILVIVIKRKHVTMWAPNYQHVLRRQRFNMLHKQQCCIAYGWDLLVEPSGYPIEQILYNDYGNMIQQVGQRLLVIHISLHHK